MDAALLLARISRAVLERMNERFAAADQSDVREALVKASRAIGSWIETLRAGEPGAPPFAILQSAETAVLRREPASLYNPDVLKAALAKD